MKRLFLIAIVCVHSFLAPAQNNPYELSFTAVIDQSFVTLDSIWVQNRSRACDTILVYPDTMLSMMIVGLSPYPQKDKPNFLSLNYPNPFIDQTTFSVNLPSKGDISLLVHNLHGQKITSYNAHLEAGKHHFTFFPGQDDWYIVTAISSNGSQSIKMNSLSSGSGLKTKLVKVNESAYKSSDKNPAKDANFEFADGDTLLFVGYASFIAGTLESGILDNPDADHSYTFQFATNIPCPETPTLTYEGQVYNTIQILSQCWLKENLNVGTMIPGIENMEDNGTIEKYCYENDTAKCTLWGGLYQWHEMMQYQATAGVQGICPTGWHIPTDEEWKVVEGAIDSQYGMGDAEWDGWQMRGLDVGHKIKSQSGWESGFNGNNSLGFTLKPGGFRYFNDGSFQHAGYHANLWSSSPHVNEYKWFRFIIGYLIEGYRNSTPRENGYSVRCIKD